MHPLPALLAETLHANDHLWGRYPPVSGTPAFREAVCAWLARRYGLPAGALDPERHVLPVAGTKEALFLIAQAVVPERKAGRRPAVLMPNPFYNVYLGGAVFAGAEPVLLPVSAADRLSAGARRAGARAARAHGRVLSLHARPTRRGSPPTRPTCSDWSGSPARTISCWSSTSATRRSTATSRRRARCGGAGAGRPARQPRGLQLALQALERGRPALGLRRRRPRA